MSSTQTPLLPPSPPSEAAMFEDASGALASASKVLAAQAGALMQISALYSGTDDDGMRVAHMFGRAVVLLHGVILRGNKIVICGMGKSFKIAGKLVATLQSFGISAATLHPSDALHGDLGNLRATDALVMITASGNTPELRLLKQHLPAGLATVVITNQIESPLAAAAHGVIAAPVSDEYTETNIYGLAAPTVTTTACLAVGDAMCIALNEMIEQDCKRRRANFKRWHPGGAIGHANSDEELVSMSQICQIPLPIECCDEVELWRAAAAERFLVCGEYVYQSAHVIEALQRNSRIVTTGRLISSAPRVDLATAQLRHGLSVVVSEDGQIRGLVWRA